MPSGILRDMPLHCLLRSTLTGRGYLSNISNHTPVVRLGKPSNIQEESIKKAMDGEKKGTGQSVGAVNLLSGNRESKTRDFAIPALVRHVFTYTEED